MRQVNKYTKDPQTALAGSSRISVWYRAWRIKSAIILFVLLVLIIFGGCWCVMWRSAETFCYKAETNKLSQPTTPSDLCNVNDYAKASHTASAVNRIESFLPPIISGSSDAFMDYDPQGNAVWNTDLAINRAEKEVPVTVVRSCTTSTGITQRRGELAFPKGSVLTDVRVEIGGWPVMTHKSALISGFFEKPWNMSLRKGDDGTLLMSNSFGCPGLGFSPSNFLDILGKTPEGKTISLLLPSVCIAADGVQGDGWALVALEFNSGTQSAGIEKISLRFKRIAGDPQLYLLIHAHSKANEQISNVRISGFPFRPHPGIVDRSGKQLWPIENKFLERERRVWVAGHDWNMQNNTEKHFTNCDVDVSSLGGIFWYNRHNNELSGMTAVFLAAEEIASVHARGTIGVTAELGCLKSSIRIALGGWAENRGAGIALKSFRDSLPSRVSRLKTMSFAWPTEKENHLLKGMVRKQINLLLSQESISFKNRQALENACRQYNDAFDALAVIPIEHSSKRIYAERVYFEQKKILEETILMLSTEFVHSGGGQ